MAFSREQNHEIHKGGTSKTRRKVKKRKKNMIKLKKRPLKMQNKVNKRNEKIAESDLLNAYQAGHRMTVCARL